MKKVLSGMIAAVMTICISHSFLIVTTVIVNLLLRILLYSAFYGIIN